MRFERSEGSILEGMGEPLVKRRFFPRVIRKRFRMLDIWMLFSAEAC